MRIRIGNILERKGDRVATIRPDDTVADAIDLLADWGIGAVVVSADGEHIDGILSERDVVRSLAGENEWTLRLRVADLMTATVVTCTAEDSIESQMAVMTERRTRHVPVIDDDDVLIGLVSIGDIVDSRLHQLEGERKMLESERQALEDYITTGR